METPESKWKMAVSYMMKVSIIIPIYKVEPYIERCIASILSQTYRNLEVILVDDCTPDRSIEIAKAVINGNDNLYHNKNDNLNHNENGNGGMNFVFLRHKYNRGLSAARNTGIDAATGDYLFFLDSDDEITNDCVEKLVKEAEEGAYDVVCGNFRIDGYVSNYWKQYQHKELKSHDKDELLRNFTNEHLYPAAWNKLLRRELIKSKSILFKEGIINEDQLWSLLLVNLITSMCVISDVTYTYRKREHSITTASTMKKEGADSFIIILHEFQKLLEIGLIRNTPDNHSYIMKKRKSFMTRIFNSNELSRKEKMKCLLRTVNLPYGIRFSSYFIVSRCWSRIKRSLKSK